MEKEESTKKHLKDLADRISELLIHSCSVSDARYVIEHISEKVIEKMRNDVHTIRRKTEEWEKEAEQKEKLIKYLHEKLG